MSGDASERPAGRRRAPRQSDIARLAGVSQWTVSVVITGRDKDQRIPPETRDRILAIARETGYTPNVAARSLRRGHNHLIGVFAYERSMSLLQASPFQEYLRGIEQETERAGYDLILFTSLVGASSSGNAYRDGTNRLNLADGSIVLGRDTDRTELGRLIQDGYRFVHIGQRDVAGAPIAYVAPDYSRAAVESIDLLADHGHRAVAYVFAGTRATEVTEAHRGRYQGFVAGIERRGLLGLDPVSETELDPEWLRRIRTAGVTAVVVETLATARSLTKIARTCGLEVPEDLSVVVLGSTRGGPQPGLRWSCTPIPQTAIGARAAQLLIQLINEGKESGNLPQELMPCGSPEAGTVTTR